jgi:hypothetical protein
MECVRCLLCGNPRHNVAGAITQADEIPTHIGGPGISAKLGGADGARCFVYSETGDVFLGRPTDGKPIIVKNILGSAVIPGGRLQGSDPGQGDEA